ncbi:Outer membrane protein A precursor [compost metagenome]
MHNNPRDSYSIWLAVITLSPWFSSSVFAAVQPDAWYLGAKAGWVEASGACGPQAISCDNSPVDSGLFVGYVLNDWLALEAGYDHFSEFNASYPAQWAPAHSAAYEGDLNGLSFVAKPYWQLSDSWSLFGKAGLMLWELDVTGDELNYAREVTDRGGSPLLGAGLEYAFNHNWRTNLEYQWLGQIGGSDTGEMDVNAVNLGIIYQFTSEPVPAPELAPAPVVIEPAHPTVELQAPWSLGGLLFASNASAITPELASALQPALQRLQANPQEHLIIDAHTDNRGSDEYNLLLSVRRAEAVRTYFIQQSVQTTQLTTKGMGESQPVADNATEEGRSKNRRVELVSVGQ